jgi:glucosyl-3-phosphoglycerate synthase
MTDFYQPRTVTTLHRLHGDAIDGLEKQLNEMSRYRPIALILPTLYRDMIKTPMILIKKELRKVEYLNEIVVTLGGATEKDFIEAKEFFKDFPLKPKIIWRTGPRIQRLYEILKKNEFSIGDDGKGRSVWLAMGYIIARDKSTVIALHDCDITTYTKELLTRLCYPVVNRSLGYEFSKGYYARFTDRLHGRVTRLFITPLIRALRMIIGNTPYLEYLDSFRYPLSGEFAMHIHLARSLNILGNWGLEIGTLSEIYRNTAVKRICQVDICEIYEHKHRKIAELVKMVDDIGKAILRYLIIEGVQLNQGLFNTLQVSYLRLGREIIERYEHDAIINGLKLNRHQENLAVESFAKTIGTTIREFEQDPMGVSFFPNWNRVNSALPEFFDLLRDAVEQDNA